MNVVTRASSWSLGFSALASRLARRSRIDLWFAGIFVLTSIFYVWTAATSQPLTLHGGQVDRYNLLASAFLHFHLWIGHAPAGLLELPEPYNPETNRAFMFGPTDSTSIGDDLLYNGNLYFVWGPAPALVLLVPLHLLGFEPSSSVTTSVFAIAGLGFTLATLRVLIRKIGSSPLWMCVLAGLTVVFSSVVPFLLRNPGTTEDTLTGGYCFMMAGIWLALSTIARGRASLTRLALASLCFGLAAGSRPQLGLSALVLVPVYLRLRSKRSPRELLPALAVPFGVCCLLLLAYNQARFNQPFEFGGRYQLSGFNAYTAPLGHFSYLSDTWSYLVTPPQITALFPFITLIVPNVSPPSGLGSPEMTGGLLPMAPIIVFLVALPWLWRRRRARLGRLAVPLMILACVGVFVAMAPIYQTFETTERYEAEFSTLIILGGVAAWLALSAELSGHRRRLMRAGGGLLAVWSCVAGLAISFTGYFHLLSIDHPGTWKTLESIGSPLSSAIVAVIGHPVLAEVAAAHAGEPPPGASPTDITIYLGMEEVVKMAIVSPDSRTVTLAANVVQRHELEPAFPPLAVTIDDSGQAARTYDLPQQGSNAQFAIKLRRGVNDLTLSPHTIGATPTAQLGGSVLFVSDLLLKG
jgi:hypothetical protein